MPKAFEIAQRALEEVGLGHRLGHYPSQLSGGEQQRVALARAVAPEPDILLADEPTGNLDTETGQKVIELLFGMQRRRGATLLLITHDPALARRCDRIIHLADGRIVDEEVVQQPGGEMTRLPTLLRIALREMRGGRTGGRVRGFRIFLLCLLLGVAIVAGVGSIAAAIDAGITADGKRILGGDYEFRLTYQPATQEQANALKLGAQISHTVEMRAMARAAPKPPAPTTPARPWSS